jgi:hypothetical protein
MDGKDKHGLERVYIVQAPRGDLLLVRRPGVWVKEAPAKHGLACTDQETFENRTRGLQYIKFALHQEN